MSDYTMGYDEGMQGLLARRSAAVQADHLLDYLEPGMRVLDMGCGPGTISLGLAKAVAPGEFHGIDMEESQVETARAAAAEKGLTNATFRVADALALPFPDEHFDAVHCSAVLTHIPDTGAALAEVLRVLKPGGVFGVREFIGRSGFIHPNVADMNGVWTMFSDLVKANGGHPEIGAALKGQMVEAGFADVQSNGWFESYGTTEAATFFTDLLEGYILGPAMGEKAVEKGLITADQLAQWRDAMAKWKADPGAFAAVAWSKTIARKP